MADRWEDRHRSDYRDDRGYRDRDQERGMVERAGDEVRSWFGDDDAARRRRLDEARDDRDERHWRDRPGSTGERMFERPRDTIANWTDRDRDGRRGLAEWNDRDRPGDRSGGYGSGYGSSYGYGAGAGNWSGTNVGRGRDDQWTRERNFGDSSRYSTADRESSPYSTSHAAWTTPQTGWSGTTNYAGRGPRGYQRTDERIREEICDRLTEDARIDASDVEVQVKGGEVTLAGSVRSRDEKRMSEDLIERISGVREVNNSLKVRPPDEVIGTARSGASVLGLTDTPPPTPAPNTPRSQK